MKYFAKTIRRNVNGKPDYEFIYKQTNGCPVYFETQKQALDAAKSLCENPALAMYDPQVGVVRK